MDTICNIEIALPRAPELVLDLLAAQGGPLSAQALCRAGALMDISETAIRVALTRLRADQKIDRAERGEYVLNPAGLSLDQAVRAWRSEPGDEVEWTGQWIAVHDGAIARADKTLWRHHQLALRLRGFSALAPDLHIRPDNRAGSVSSEWRALQALGLASKAMVFRLADLDPTSDRRARGLWHAPQLLKGYRALSEALKAHQAAWPRLAVPRALRESLLLGRSAIQHLVRDPMLPEAFVASAPRRELARLTRHYTQQAHALW
ncbi:MAG: PaaX family transcriptional regulator, partial [Paucibacter sp.]|nr:PaaX family transcriptional regulator [Roseateles sp.]